MANINRMEAEILFLPAFGNMLRCREQDVCIYFIANCTSYFSSTFNINFKFLLVHAIFMKLQIGLNIQQNMDYLPTKFNNTAHINPPEMNGI